MEIHARNVNDALAQALIYLQREGIKEESRNGPVLVAPEPVMTIYARPWERVLFSPERDANPFFHLMESLWMLAGRNDVEWPAYFAGNIRNYSDDGQTLHGAYGYRWHISLEFNQLVKIAEELKRNPESRRCVLQMWDGKKSGHDDLRLSMNGGKDVPCNTHIYFDCRDKALNLTVLCRSNDIWWGCYGANAVHFSILQEFLAAWIGVPMGAYRQFSNNWHAYTNVMPAVPSWLTLATTISAHDAYTYDRCSGFALINSKSAISDWIKDLYTFMSDPAAKVSYHDPFFADIARPMYLAWKARKEKRGSGIDEAQHILADDWRRACCEWIARRELKKELAK